MLMKGCVHNARLSARAADERALLQDGSHVFCLYQNVYNPDSAMTLAQFQEGGFPGYVRHSLVGKVSAPAFVEDGRYRLTIGPFPYPLLVDWQVNMRGWFILDLASGRPVYAQRWFPFVSFSWLDPVQQVTAWIDLVGRATPPPT